MAKLRTSYFDLDDLRIAYYEVGDGPILMFLHGNSESKRIFLDYQLKHFSAFHTFALDSRGHGQSISKDSQYTISQFSLDVIRFCEGKGLKNINLVGYSDGGNIALHLAHKAPGLFRKIIAISPNTLASGTEEKSLRTFIRMKKCLTKLGQLGFNTKKQIMRIDLMLNDIGLDDDQLRQISLPLLILYAEKEMIKVSHIQHIANLIPNADLKMIPGSTHMNILHNSKTHEAIKAYFLNKS